MSGGFLAGPVKPWRIGAYALLLVLGAVAGAAGALVQGGWFPGGLILALLGAGGVFYGGARATSTKGGALAGAAGWLIAVMLLLSNRPEGDLVFGAGLGVSIYLLGGLVVAVMCATLGPLAQPPLSADRLGK